MPRITSGSVQRAQNWEPEAHSQPLPMSERPGKEKEKGRPTTGRPVGRPQKEPLLPKPPIVGKAQGGLDIETTAQMALMNVEYGSDGSAGRIRESILAYLPTPHPKQVEIEQSTAKRKVINCGRRVGKTTLAARVAAIKMVEGKRVLIASTTQEQADAAWEKLTTWLQPFIEAGYIKKNETKRVLLMPETGGRIKCKTASDADTLRGDYADFLVLDECALLAENAWTEVGAPMLLDNNGDCWFLSTPRRRNWFHGLNVKALGDNTGRWEAFHATSFDNPYLSEEALSEIMDELTDDGYKQEILAEFLEGEGAVFRNISDCMHAPMTVDPKEHWFHRVVGGLDWGRHHDDTVIDVFCATCMREIYMDRFTKIEYALQHDRVVNTTHAWNVGYWLGEANSMGGPVVEALQKAGINVEPFDTEKASKGELVQAFALALEKETAQWQDIKVAKSQLEAYEGTKSRVTGHIAYAAPKGVKDDTVMGRMLAYRAAMIGTPAPGPVATSYADLMAVSSMDDGYSGGDYDPNDTGTASMPYASGQTYQTAEGYAQALYTPRGGRPW